ncbi:chaperonin 10-like protein [Chytriomyces cf. hyalinus JEL632]|nr:chaperonin 10-like protein [Chytriomyces cf. hyalinus JEL632]
MMAVVLAEPFRVEVRNVATPAAEDLAPGGAIVKVTLAGLCGSDLHVYRGSEPVPPGVVTMGHGFVGTVFACRDITGKDASSAIRVESIVVAPFTTSCLRCVACQRGFTSRCGKSKLFGSVSLSGGQAEFVTVPNAEGTLLCVDTLHNSIWSPQRALNEASPVQALEVPVLTFAIVGLGPVGTCALVSLLDVLLNPTAAPLRLPNNSLVETRRIRILMSDGVKERRDAAVGIVDCIRKTEGPAFFKNAEFLAMDIDEAHAWSVAQGDNNRADAVVEAVGANEAVLLAYGLLRSFGVLSSVGVHTAPTFPLTGDDFYNKNVALSFGRCPVRGILPLVLETLGRRQDIFAKISSQESDGIGLIDRIVDMGEATEMYKQFNDRKVGKVLFQF